MKILLLNPYLDASHDIVRVLQKRGMALLVSADAGEAWQMLLLHGTTVDLAVVHREGPGGTGEPGFRFISQLKQDPAQADLPFIITSEKWTDGKFAEHQEGPQGANAYLKFPFSAHDLIQLIEGVLSSTEEAKPTPKAVLEEAASVFKQADSEGNIHLDAPEMPPTEDLQAKPEDLEDDKIFLYTPHSEESRDAAAEQEMPYLYASSGANKEAIELDARVQASSFQFSQPVGDAVVPGGAAQSPDLETLKKYLLLREQDVAALSGQLKSAREQLTSLEDILSLERAKNVELSHTVDEQRRKLEDFEKDKKVEIEILQNDVTELRFQMKAKADKARVLEAKMREATEETERLKDRVRGDIRKIRVREKELENRLEIMKRDSEALIAARENKIIELKRKLDLFEFNMDLMQDQFSREKENMVKARERLVKASQAVRVASRILDGSAQMTEEEDKAAS